MDFSLLSHVLNYGTDITLATTNETSCFFHIIKIIAHILLLNLPLSYWEPNSPLTPKQNSNFWTLHEWVDCHLEVV